MSARRAAVRRWLPWLPALMVMVVIFALSSQSGLAVSDDPSVDRPVRATGHLLAYGLLSALLLTAISWGRRPRPQDALIAIAIAVGYGLTDEFHQSFVPTRSGRLEDVVIDAAGALVGAGLAWIALAALARSRGSSAGARAVHPRDG